jgi:hypothetical protein
MVSASVAMIQVGALDAGDALELIRGHQPARLHPDFNGSHEEGAARLILKLLNGYALANEHAALDWAAARNMA